MAHRQGLVDGEQLQPGLLIDPGGLLGRALDESLAKDLKVHWRASERDEAEEPGPGKDFADSEPIYGQLD
jgi:hypothetical protein